MGSNNSKASFYDEPEINAAFLGFLKIKADFPYKELNAVKRRIKPLLHDFARVLARRGVDCTWLYAWSVAEGVRILPPDGTIEVDVEFTIKVTGAEVTLLGEGRAEIKVPQSGQPPRLPKDMIDPESRHVSPKGIRKEFDTAFSSVYRSWHDAFEDSGCIVHEEKGPAHQVTISKNGKPWLYLDLVPVLEVDGKERFVAKEPPYGKREPFYWRQSFSCQERNQYPKKGEKPLAKPCLRVLKALAARSAELRKLDTYVFKHLLFWEIKENPKDSWKEQDVARRIWGLLERLKKCPVL